MPAKLGRAHNAPGDAKARAIETAKWAFQALDARQKRVFAHFNIFHYDLTGNAGAKALLASYFRRAKAGHFNFQHEATNLTPVGIGFRPDDEDISDWAVRNPHF